MAQVLEAKGNDGITNEVYEIVCERVKNDRHLLSLRSKPSRTALRTMWQRFETGGTISKRKSPGRPRRPRDEIVRLLNSDSKFSLRSIAEKCQCSLGLVSKVAKKELKLRYYVQRVGQVLSDSNVAYRLQFAENLLNLFNSGTIDIDNFCIIDESYVEIGEHRNRRNNGFWRKAGDTWNIPVLERPLKPQHIMIFCVLHSKIGVIGPFFMKDIDPERTSMNSKNFMDMVDLVVPQIKEKLGPLFDSCWWFQDGAPPHFAKNSIDKLKSYFENRICARGTDFSWPPYSPDLTPLDYWFWSALKTFVGAKCPKNLDEVESVVREFCSAVTPTMVKKAIHDMPARLECLKDRGGTHFEHMFKEWKRMRRKTQPICPYCDTKHPCLCPQCDIECMRRHLEADVDSDDSDISDFEFPMEFLDE